MGRIRFERQAPVMASDPQRADVACFVGLVGRRPGAVPDAVRIWLVERGWLASPYERPPQDALLDLPVPIDTWDAFDQMFAWDRRPLDDQGQVGATYLGAAVRSFFAQGGRKCYVVRVAAPLPYGASPAERQERLGRLVPRLGDRVDVSPGDRRTWRGVGHLFGLPDVSFLCLPDLPDLVRDLAPPPAVEIARTEPPERFVECSAPEPPPPVDGWARRLAAPRCDEQGYGRWARTVRAVAQLLAERLREVHLVTAVPLPREEAEIDPDVLSFRTAFVQLAYPWLRTPGSQGLPEELESPDGALAGLLARSALARGAFRSAAGLALVEASALAPELRRDQTERIGDDGLALIDRVSLFGPTPSGLRLLSDVTASADPSYRQAGVSRLVSTLVRAARRLGEDSTFEPSGEALWARLQDRASTLLRALWDRGALRGATPEEAFEVRCDRSTMSQQDIDQGRVIARVRFEAAAPVEAITVVLARDEGGQVSLESPEAA
ncbi:MAG TPA: phage tail sheath protein [Thermoanaerobaculia bacterium]|jgi:hypothetical protein